MAHEVENMFSVSEVPWHKLGRILPAAPTVEEGIVAAGLDWTVGTKALQTADTQETVPALATYRQTDGKILGVVGPSYQVLQNREAFNFFQPFLDAKLATLETAGSLRDGQRVWVLAKINKEDSVIVKQSDDTIKKYILLSNSHDGTLAVRVGYTPVRVVCNNTMQMAFTSKESQLIRIRHVGDINANLEKIREIMDVANAQFEATADQFRRLASKQINQEDLKKYIKVVFATKKQMDNVISIEDLTSGARVTESITHLFEKGRGNDLPGVKGTWWAAYNAISEHLQYFRGNDEATRLDSLWFGTGAALNKKALETAIKMAA